MNEPGQSAIWASLLQDQAPWELCWYTLSAESKELRETSSGPSCSFLNKTLLLHVKEPLFSAPWSHPDTGRSSCYHVLSNPRDSFVLLIGPSPMLHCTRWTCPLWKLEHAVLLPSKKGKVQWHEPQAALKLTDMVLNLKGSWNLVQISF